MADELKALIEGWRRRAAEDEAARARARSASLERVKPAVRVLVEEFGANRVVLFGSSATGTSRPESDIDLAVSGVAPARFVQALLALEGLLGADRVDLVDLDTAGALLSAKLEGEGIVLHG